MTLRTDTAPACVRVCVATHRRPALLRRTLDSVAAQRFERCREPDLRVIVVDNDAAQEGRAVVEAVRAAMRWPIDYAVEERPGIAHARNRLMAEAGDADYVAMIDDDEAADEHWLDALLAVARETDADAVLGPVEPVFDAPPAEWMRPFFLRRRHATGARVPAEDFRTGNVLLALRALRGIEGPFDPAFGLTGGEDSFLGRQLEARGASFHWADDAIVREACAAERTRVGWILRRRFRSATTLTAIRIRMMGHGPASALVIARTAGLAAIGSAQIATSALGGRSRLLSGVANLATVAGNIAGFAGLSCRSYGAGCPELALRVAPPRNRSRV